MHILFHNRGMKKKNVLKTMESRTFIDRKPRGHPLYYEALRQPDEWTSQSQVPWPLYLRVFWCEGFLGLRDAEQGMLRRPRQAGRAALEGPAARRQRRRSVPLQTEQDQTSSE